MSRRLLSALLFALAGLHAPALSAAPVTRWPAGVVLPPGQPVSEAYRRQFDLCDSAGVFRGHRSRFTRSCRGDPNAATMLRRLPDGAIAYVSKLAVDLDGSAFACGPDHGTSDQCPTSLMLPDGKGGEVPVDADAVPYVVIPEAGPPDTQGEFSRLTGVQVGDFGVVIANGRTVPVIVADTGPFAKLGEGSMALHRALGHDICAGHDRHGACNRLVPSVESVGGDVTTILYPGSARTGLTPATIAAVTRAEGTRLWAAARKRMR